MAVLDRIGLASAFKVGLVSYALLGLAAGVLCSLAALSGPFFPHARVPFAGGWGVLALIVCPIAYGLVGGIAVLVSAFLYNLASRWVGGVDVDIH